MLMYKKYSKLFFFVPTRSGVWGERTEGNHVIIDGLTVVRLKIQVLCNMMQCGCNEWVLVFQRNLVHHIPLKHQKSLTQWHCITAKKM